MEDECKINIISKDGIYFAIDIKSAQRSGLLKNIITDYDTKESITIEEVNGNILKLILDYLVHYRDTEPRVIPRPLPTSNLLDVTDKWDVDFINLDKSILFELIIACNFMDVIGLLELSSSKIASIMKNMDSETIKREFAIPEDMTKEEQEKMEEEELGEYQEQLIN